MSFSLKNYLTSDYVKVFCEGYKTLSEDLIYWDKDFMSLIEETEKETFSNMINGSEKKFANETDLRLHFMRIKVKKIKEIILLNDGAKKRQVELSEYLAHHSFEVNMLKLDNNGGERLTPTQIYANYYCVCNYLNMIQAYLDSQENKKK